MKKAETFKRIAALVIAFTVGAGGCFVPSFAETAMVSQDDLGDAVIEEQVTEIEDVQALEAGVLDQTITAYSGGEPVLPVTHSWAGHEFESRNIWNHADFKRVSYSSKKRGDLVFYKG